MEYNPCLKRYKRLRVILILLLLFSIFLSIMMGRYPISPKEITGIILSKFYPIQPFWQPTQFSLLMNHRLPRVLIATLVGAALACSGATYQGVFQNPFGTPDILGASSGAAFGAALAILLYLPRYMVICFAFIFGLGTVLLVIFIGSHTSKKEYIGLILAGIMVSSFVTSGTSFIKLVADPTDQLPAITFWLMGSLNKTSLSDLSFAMIPIGLGILPLYLYRWRINLLSLGDEQARILGINPKRVRLILILASTLITATAVAVSGMIDWIGLIIPHLSRRLIGSNYQYLFPTSLLAGSIFLLWVDTIARNLLATEIPLGILTAFVGAPCFIYMLTKGEGLQ